MSRIDCLCHPFGKYQEHLIGHRFCRGRSLVAAPLDGCPENRPAYDGCHRLHLNPWYGATVEQMPVLNKPLDFDSLLAELDEPSFSSEPLLKKGLQTVNNAGKNLRLRYLHK